MLLTGNDRGFTLVEIIVAAAVSMVLLGAIYMAINSAQRSTMGIERKVAVQQDVRPALELMAMEIRMASYNPMFTRGIWLDPADCFSASVNQQYLGIQNATPTSITIEMDIGPNSPSGFVGDDTNEIIAYAYDMANQRITRETKRSPPGACTPGGQPFLGDTVASGNPRTVLVVNDVNGNGVYDDGTDIPVFRYYDGTGTLIAASSLPGAIPNIRRIEITLAVQTEFVNPDTNQRRSLIYSTSVIPRNHAQ
jgi:prepilin-type N-terminal cleavage/methylation domain-containing protein